MKQVDMSNLSMTLARNTDSVSIQGLELPRNKIEMMFVLLNVAINLLEEIEIPVVEIPCEEIKKHKRKGETSV